MFTWKGNQGDIRKENRGYHKEFMALFTDDRIPFKHFRQGSTIARF